MIRVLFPCLIFILSGMVFSEPVFAQANGSEGLGRALDDISDDGRPL